MKRDLMRGEEKEKPEQLTSLDSHPKPAVYRSTLPGDYIQQCFRPVVLKRNVHQRHEEVLLKHRSLDRFPRVSDSVVQGGA